MRSFTKLVSTAAVGVAFTAGPALALDWSTTPEASVPASSTPSSVQASTPEVSTPFVSTPAFATPEQQVDATVPAVTLPAQASLELSGAVEGEHRTPSATPSIDQHATVPSEAVPSVTVDSQSIASESVTATVPAGASVSSSNAAATTDDDAASFGMGWGGGTWHVSVHAGSVVADVGVGIG